MRHNLFTVFILLMLSACGTPNGAGQGANSSSSISNPQTGATDSELAFKNTLYPILRENCAICHGGNGPGFPDHANSSLGDAYKAAVNLVDLSAPQASRFVSRLQVDKHMCWSDCAENANTLQQAISAWANLLDSGGSVAECNSNFAQDLILLADTSYLNSIKSLFGNWVVNGLDVPDPATKLFSQKSTVANTSLLNTRLEWAAYVASEFQRRAAQASGCLQSNRACAQSYIEKIAHRAFKRPVTATEINDLMTVFDQGATNSFTYGIRLAAQAILISPSFNHRTEFGQRNVDGNYSLTTHEFASTLSYLLTDSLPDEELLQAADSGALNNSVERDRQVDRLLSMESTKSSLEYTLLSAWNLGNIFGKVKDPDTFPQYSANLASQMYEETRLFLRRHLWSGGLNNLLTSRTTFVNGALADLYGVSFSGSDRNQFVEVTLDDGRRSGLLTQASLLTAYSRTDETSVVARGLFVNGPLLCMPKVPAPPEELIAEIQQQLNADSTEKERADYRATTEPCKNCHSQFDRYGLLFEQFDAIGQHRSFDEKGHSIQAGLDLTGMADFNGYVSGPVEFAEVLAQQPEFVGCITRHLLAYGTGEDGIKRSQCEVTTITDQLNANSSLADLIKAIAKSPALSTRIAEEAR